MVSVHPLVLQISNVDALHKSIRRFDSDQVIAQSESPQIAVVRQAMESLLQ